MSLHSRQQKFRNDAVAAVFSTEVAFWVWQVPKVVTQSFKKFRVFFEYSSKCSGNPDSGFFVKTATAKKTAVAPPLTQTGLRRVSWHHDLLFLATNSNRLASESPNDSHGFCSYLPIMFPWYSRQKQFCTPPRCPLASMSRVSGEFEGQSPS